MSEQVPATRKSRRDQRIDRAFHRSLAAIFLLFLIVAGLAVWLHLPESAGELKQSEMSLPDVRQAPVAEVPQVLFADVTALAGITFVHENGAYGEKLLPETMGSGCALFDYDGDGDADILLINSTCWPEDPRPPAPGPATMALYRNEGDWTFTDVTQAAGLDISLYGMGVAVGDYDNDGDRDLFVTAVGPNRLLRNDAGVFVDVTDEASVSGAANQWSSSCAWLDYNNDGRLDLFVCNYIRWSREIDLAQLFSLDGSTRAYGPPLAFEGAFASVYRNEGGGRFRDVSQEVGVQIVNPATGVPMAKSLGVAPVDLDGDGWLDVVVANDTVQNFVFHNQQGAGFREVGAMCGVAFDSFGNARGAMGIDIGHFRNDDTLGIVIGNFANEMTALYVSLGDPMQYFDAAVATGLGPPTRLELTFGVFFFDYDLDGRLDLLSTNGHLEETVQKVQESQRYAQSPQLFWNGGTHGECEFVRVPAEKCGPDLPQPMVGRGSAFADLDGDGDLDVLITGNGQAPRLLRNDQQLAHHWLRFHLRGNPSNRDAIGARLDVHVGDQVLPRWVMPTRGYLSQSELPVTVGLATASRVAQVVIRWPDGEQQVIESPAMDQLHVIEQNEAEPAAK